MVAVILPNHLPNQNITRYWVVLRRPFRSLVVLASLPRGLAPLSLGPGLAAIAPLGQTRQRNLDL